MYDRLFPIQFSKHSTYSLSYEQQFCEWNGTRPFRIYLRGVSNQASKSHTPPGRYIFFHPTRPNFSNLNSGILVEFHVFVPKSPTLAGGEKRKALWGRQSRFHRSTDTLWWQERMMLWRRRTRHATKQDNTRQDRNM